MIITQSSGFQTLERFYKCIADSNAVDLVFNNTTTFVGFKHNILTNTFFQVLLHVLLTQYIVQTAQVHMYIY